MTHRGVQFFCIQFTTIKSTFNAKSYKNIVSARKKYFIGLSTEVSVLFELWRNENNNRCPDRAAERLLPLQKTNYYA
jgi:hypothetical protein